MTSRASARTAAVGGLLAACCLATLGCQHVVNPHVDETISSDDITTATAEGVYRGAKPTGAEQRIRGGEWPAVNAAAHAGSVSHWPLWFEDPFEDQGSEDGRFAVTWEDHLAWPLSTGRWVLNCLGWPASAVVTPPFTIMSSDGVISRQLLGPLHDAEVGPGQAKDVGEAESLSVQGTVVQATSEPPGEETSE